MILNIADLFCGAGGTSTGAMEAVLACGHTPKLKAFNHWSTACNTHRLNHPESEVFCAELDSLNPRDAYGEGELDILWASPECTHHSQARGGKPINDQSRSTAWCVVRWADALRPAVVLVENVPEFETWGGIGSNGRPLQSKRGATFLAWVGALESLGYTVDWRVLCAANYGDPTTRKRLFVQAVRGRRKIVWPEPTHASKADIDLFGGRAAWRSSESHVIDWSIPAPSIVGRKRPLKPKTIARINEGLREYGSPVIICMEHGGRVIPTSQPLPTVTCARGGAFGVAYLLPQHGGGKLRSASEPAPTVACAGAIGLIVEYYGNGGTQLLSSPLPTVTCKDRFALVTATPNDIGFRMLRPHELAAAQGFRRSHQFTGTKTDQVKQIGNAVPRRLARALCIAAISQQSDITTFLSKKHAA